MSYSVELKEQAIKQLEKITPNIQSRMVKKLRWLEKNIDNIKLLPLTANLSGFYKLRIGDYRVIYTINYDQQIITVHEIGHRRDIYD